MIYSLDEEGNVLAGLLRHPQMFTELQYINESDFDSDSENRHKLIFSVLTQFANEGKPFDIPLIASHINNITIGDGFDFCSYLEALKHRSVSEKGVLEAAKALKNISIRRELAEMGNNIVETMRGSAGKSFDENIALVDQIYSKVTRSYSSIDEPVDIFAMMEEIVEGNGDAEDDESDEIIFPYENYHKLFGGLFPGDLVMYASEAKAGKSTLLQNISSNIVMNYREQGRQVKVLTLDTEMETEKVIRRICSQISGVNEYLLKTNRWRKNPELVKKVRAVWKYIKDFQLTDTSDHIYIGNMTTEAMLAQVRRWFYKNIRSRNVGKDKKDHVKALVILDYFKLTAVDNVSDAFASSMQLGYRVDSFKKLASELQIPILSSCQTNAQNEVGLSREMGKFASAIHMFERLPPEEVVNSPNGATHRLTPKLTRDQGEFSEGFNDLVKMDVGGKIEYKKNCIFYNVEKFRVSELTTLREHADLMQHDDGKIVSKKNKDDDEF